MADIKDVVLSEIGLYERDAEYIDELFDSFSCVDDSDFDYREWIGYCLEDPRNILLCNLIIGAIFEQVINYYVSEYGLDESKFSYDVNAEASSLYYGDEYITSDEDLEQFINA